MITPIEYGSDYRKRLWAWKDLRRAFLTMDIDAVEFQQKALAQGIDPQDIEHELYMAEHGPVY